MNNNKKIDPEKINLDSHLDKWLATAKETIENPSVKKYIEGNEIFQKILEHMTVEKLITDLNDSMFSYALDWTLLSELHNQHETYKQMADFFKPQGLIVDIGCGTGKFALATGIESVLCIDINPYMLQIAQKTLKQEGRESNLYSDSYISFHPDKGFIIKPVPVLDLDLSKTNLLCDDFIELHNTIRVLYNQGIKADAASFTLHGGRGSTRHGEFISVFRHFCGDKAKLEDDEPLYMMEQVLKKINKIVKPDGKLYLAMRGELAEIDEEQDSEGLFEKYKDNIEAIRTKQISMMNERNLTGISVSPHIPGKELTKEEQKKFMSKGYKLCLIECRVK